MQWQRCTAQACIDDTAFVRCCAFFGLTTPSSLLSTLIASLITGSQLNMNFYDGTNGVGLNVNTTNLTVTGGSTQFRLNATGAVNVIFLLSRRRSGAHTRI